MDHSRDITHHQNPLVQKHWKNVVLGIGEINQTCPAAETKQLMKLVGAAEIPRLYRRIQFPQIIVLIHYYCQKKSLPPRQGNKKAAYQ